MTYANTELMSLPDIALYLGMSERTIYQWAQQGRIPSFKLGTSWRFRKSEIDTWLETQRSGPDPRLLVDPVEPPKSRRQIRLEEEEVTEASIAACMAFIEATIQSDDRDVWTVDQFQDRFGENSLEESLKRLRKQKKISLGEEKGLGRDRVKIIRRRD